MPEFVRFSCFEVSIGSCAGILSVSALGQDRTGSGAFVAPVRCWRSFSGGIIHVPGTIGSDFACSKPVRFRREPITSVFC